MKDAVSLCSWCARMIGTGRDLAFEPCRTAVITIGADGGETIPSARLAERRQRYLWE